MEDQSQFPAWLTGRPNPQEPAKEAPYVPDRVTLDIWDSVPPWTQEDILSVVIRLDGEVVGKPLSKEDGCAVCNWLQDALPDLEYQMIKEIERLDQEAAEEEHDKRTAGTDVETHGRDGM